MSENLCSICNEWKKEEYEFCYTCSMKNSGKKICPECGDKYYDPAKFECCYFCYGTKPKPKAPPPPPEGLLTATPTLCFLDTETTGFLYNRLVQLAYALKVPGEELQPCVNLLVKPRADIEPGATEVHGITNDDVKDLAHFDETEEYETLKLLARTPSNVIVCHNAVYDIGVLMTEGIGVEHRICTMKISQRMMPCARNHKLQTLREILHLSEEGKAHDAAGDVSTLVELFKVLFNLYIDQTGKDHLAVINDFISFSK